MDENNKKISFFTRIKWSIFNPEHYDIFAVEQTKIAFAYFIRIILVFSLITAIGITYKFATTDISKVPEIQEFITEETINYIQSVPKAELYTIFYCISAVYLFIIYFFVIAMDVLLLSLLGYLTSRIAKVMLKYTAIVNISIYALTLPIILNATYILVNSFTSFEVKYFQIMYNAVAYIYEVTAILMIKSEIIKQEAELAKLEEEQKKVREELEKQQEEEKQKEEQKRKEREEEKKKKEKENEDKEPGNAPEGSSAITECNSSNSENHMPEKPQTEQN